MLMYMYVVVKVERVCIAHVQCGVDVFFVVI